MAAVAVVRAQAAVAAATDNHHRANLRPVLWLVLFGVAFGYLEASVVVYLRTIIGPMRMAYGLRADEPLPLLRLDQVTPAILSLAKVELGREAATLIMIAAAAGAFAWTRGPQAGRMWLGAFLLAFGVWDLTFYGWLRVLIDWPQSLLTWDVLFLVPVPWAAPVLAPMIAAATFSIFGAALLVRPHLRAPRSAGVVLGTGFIVMLATFTWDWRHWLAGGLPQSFAWLPFAVGEALMVLGCLGFFRLPATNKAVLESVA